MMAWPNQSTIQGVANLSKETLEKPQQTGLFERCCV